MPYSYGRWKIYGTITDFQERNDLVLITDSQNVADALLYLGEFNAFLEDAGLLVKAEDGDYTEVYLFYGIPYIYKTVWKLKEKEK